MSLNASERQQQIISVRSSKLADNDDYIPITSQTDQLSYNQNITYTKDQHSTKKRKHHHRKKKLRERTQEKSTAKKLLGIILMVISGLAYSLLAAGVKAASNLGYSAGEILVYRATIQILFSIFTMILQKIKTKYKKYEIKNKQSTRTSVSLMESTGKQNNINAGGISKKNSLFDDDKPKLTPKVWVFVLLRGVFGAASTFTYFESSILIPLGDCVSLKALAAVLTTFAGWMVLKEPISCAHFIALNVSIIGIFLIAQPPFLFSLFDKNISEGPLSIGYYLAMASSCAQTCIYLCIRKAKIAPPTVLMISQGTACIICGISINFIGNIEWHFFQSYEDVLCILGVGCIGFVSQYCLTKGSQLLIAGLASLFRCTDIFWSFLWQVILFGDNPNFITILGGFLMFSSVILVTLDKIKRTKDKNPPPNEIFSMISSTVD